jgi:hypothetical protein
MSLATSESHDVSFLARFERIRASLRQYQAAQGLGWLFLALALGMAALTVADFWLELPWRARAVGFYGVMALVFSVFCWRVVAPLWWWTKRRTAAEIESRFPKLGQRIRTVVQFAGRHEEEIDSEGVMPSLVSALEEDTEIQAKPLPLDTVVPWARVKAVAALSAMPVLIMLVAAIASSEWRTAIARAFLSSRPYTTLVVAPGDLTIEQGENVVIDVTITGRLNRDVVLYTRRQLRLDASWKATSLDAPKNGPLSKRETKLEKISEPIEYRVVAGPAESPEYRIGVRYPLAIKSFEIGLAPPAYTNIAPSTVKGGDIRAVEGTDATFRLAFDSTPVEPALVTTDPSTRSKKGKAEPTPRVVPLNVDGTLYTARLNLTRGLVYQIQAKTADGRSVAKNRYKIDVFEDRAPRVSFEQPDEALEVHPIAEIVNRIRVGDDFGLTRAGIIFQFNNGEEQTLIVKDFRSEPAKSRTSAALQETLLLEKLAASPTDSLAYYAFAEDNYPAGARRTETDLRYLDIRPFRREYKLAQDMDGVPLESDLVSLAELIARQRFNLNRATRLAKHKPTDKTLVDDPLKVAGFEETLAGLTRELTAGVEGIVGQRIEPLHAAEESMLAAVTALDRGENGQAPNHMGQALRHLIEARDTLRVAIAQDAKAAQAMRSFDRMQAQKIRKPKKDTEEAEEIAEEIEQLAQDEDFVYATLVGLSMEQEPKPAKASEQTGKSESDAEKKSETADKKEDHQKDANGQGGETEKGSSGKKGQGKGKGKGKGTGKGQSGEKGEPDDADNDSGQAQKNDKRREAVEKQEKIADRARELEEKLKKLEAASDLAKLRMAKAAETAEKASGALSRGNTKEATATAKTGAAMLHELARQVKGEIARDVAQELAMARDLADELAQREADLGQMPATESGQSGREDQSGGQPGQRQKGQSGKSAQGDSGGRDGGYGGWTDLTDAERLERLEEAAKTLEHWLKDASLRAEGDSAERIRELVEDSALTRIVERMERIGELYLGGDEKSARRDAVELSKMLELLARQLEVLHRGIVSPELAKLVEFDKRIAELTAKLKTIKTDAEIADWRRLATELVRDLERAGLTDGAHALADAFDAGGWNWGVGDYHFRATPAVITKALNSVSVELESKIQNLILKDIASARDEPTPPEFKELVERYYEVLSKESRGK